MIVVIVGNRTDKVVNNKRNKYKDNLHHNPNPNLNLNNLNTQTIQTPIPIIKYST